jgi:alkane 1-monooxygenase
MIPAAHVAKFARALPYWMSLALFPLIAFVAGQGGWWLLAMPLMTWWLFSLLDLAMGLDLENADPATPEADLFWYRLVTLVWFPLQLVTIFALIHFVTQNETLSTAEAFGLFFGVGVISGTIGINYSHELMHQTNRLERWLADLLLASVLYSHFRSEHLLVHHRYVGTTRDPVTARYNEGFFRFFPRVLRDSLISAFQAEKAMLARRDKAWTDPAKPFWRYWLLQGLFVTLAFALGGWLGVALFIFQAAIAVWQLELTNYIEHYGLTRKHLGEGKYEHVQPRHSWNAAHKASNWLLINLQRHSDHHYKPDRRFPLLQNYTEDAAPQLPFGYPVMTMAAMIPPLWRRIMNPRVKAWRKQFYPEVSDWQPYNKGALPAPR